MKQYEIELKHDAGSVTVRTFAGSIAAAQEQVCKAEKAPKTALGWWRVVPTAKQIRKTQNLLRCI